MQTGHAYLPITLGKHSQTGTPEPCLLCSALIRGAVASACTSALSTAFGQTFWVHPCVVFLACFLHTTVAVNYPSIVPLFVNLLKKVVADPKLLPATPKAIAHGTLFDFYRFQSVGFSGSIMLPS